MRESNRFVPLMYTAMVLALIQAAVTLPFKNPGTDFTPVWNAARKYLAGQPVFDSDYTIDMPHYLYTPGGTVVIAPLGLFPDQPTARLIFLALGALSIVAAIAIATRLSTTTYFHTVFPLAVTTFFLSPEPVRTTLYLTNINGFLLLLLVVFVWMCLRTKDAGLRGHLSRPETYIAGIAAGIAITVKPQFAVILIVPLAFGQLAAIVTAGLTFVVLFAIGWFTIAAPDLFFSNLVPYLSEPRPRYNGSVGGLGILFGWPSWLVTLLTIVVVASTAAAIAALWPWRKADPVMWSFATIAACLAGGFMASGLLQFYYAIWLIPFVLTLIRQRSPMHWPLTFLIIALMFANPGWPKTDIPALNIALGNLPAFAFLALPIVIAAWAAFNRPLPAETDS
ncbi:glycosyltransferase family 87 protein [Corynebacterium aquatimens]|uniref:Arabinofuranan 3-O-arabinosyltransferase n=1 Tax=Corynebacterium aquatimens TaxID=1190508 RepID=A0A931E234_9CORY|nr:glycosyltransferase family 87 protein [Corynebacterium aquatimens]MBG6122843.1 arabinofuranan 3-O-arabinosyltransferase [Corynebacterium aquatimens]WJY66822.1 Alpha-(1->3)-arabinofuranosyltransferase [Corynebacterium aquatimens]